MVITNMDNIGIVGYNGAVPYHYNTTIVLDHAPAIPHGLPVYEVYPGGAFTLVSDGYALMDSLREGPPPPKGEFVCARVFTPHTISAIFLKSGGSSA